MRHRAIGTKRDGGAYQIENLRLVHARCNMASPRGGPEVVTDERKTVKPDMTHPVQQPEETGEPGVPQVRQTRSCHIRFIPAQPCFPMPDDELNSLAADIARNGLRDKITLWRATDGEQLYLVDGRNRLAALERLPQEVARTLAAEPNIVSEVSPASFVISANIRRRHLTKRQQATLIFKTIRAEESRIDPPTSWRVVQPDERSEGRIHAGPRDGGCRRRRREVRH